MALGIKITKKENFIYVVDLTGSIDGETYEQLENELKEIIDDKTRAVFLDMNGVTYVSSIGLRAIIVAKKAMKTKNTTFAIVNLTPPIKKVFDLMKIMPMVSLFNDMPEVDKYIDQIIKEESDKQNTPQS